MEHLDQILLVLAIVPVAYYVYKETAPRAIRKRRAKEALTSYLTSTSADPDVDFHTQYSTLPIPCKDIDGVDHRNTLSELLARLQVGTLGWTLLTGDLGGGKTATLSLLFVELARRYRANELPLYPILVRLRDDWDPADIASSLAKHVNLQDLRRQRGTPTVVLLLDSLDEFAMRYGHQLTLEQIAKHVLHSPLLEKCIVILSTRPSAISDLDRSERYRTVWPHQYQLLDLQHTDVDEYVRQRGLSEALKALSAHVRRLLNKPLFLYFFITAARQTVGAGRSRPDFTDEARLYDWFFREWYSWAQTNMGLATKLPPLDVLRQLLQLLALESSGSVDGSLSEQQIRSTAVALVHDHPDLDPFLSDLLAQARVRWLLVHRTDGGSGRFHFIHSSLRDYFLSGPLAEEYKDPASHSHRIAHAGELSLLFVAASLSREESLSQLVRSRIAALQDPRPPDALHAAISVVLWLDHGAEALGLDVGEVQWLQSQWRRLNAAATSHVGLAVRGAIRKVRLSFTTLENLDLQNYDLSNSSDLSGSTLINCNFIGGDAYFKLSSVKLDGATLRNCRFVRVELLDASFHGATFDNCEFDSCQLQRVKASGSRWQSSRVARSSDLTGADLSRATLQDSQFEDCKLVGAMLDSCEAERATFRRCDLYQMSVTACRRRDFALDECYNIPSQW